MIIKAQVAELASAYGRGASDPAYLDLAQEHLLHWLMYEMNAFHDGHLAFKGGTALRKFRFGKNGRFSTDLDFWTTDVGFAGTVIDILGAGFTHEGVTFGRTGPKKGDQYELHASWWAEAPGFGKTLEPSAIEFSVRHRFREMVMPKTRPAIPGVDARMGFSPPLVPIYDILETVAEKLSRVRRKPMARDLYDLALIGPSLSGDDLLVIRRLLAFKVALDRYEGNNQVPIPFRGGPDFVGLAPDSVTAVTDIGRLAARTMTTDEMCKKLGQYFGPMGAPTGALEVRLARCHPNDGYWCDTQVKTWDAGL